MALAGLGVVLAVQASANTRLRANNEALALAQRETAAERDAARAINAFLVDDLLAQANPENNPVEGKVTVLEILDRAADRVPGRFDRQPQVEAAIRLTIGMTYRGLGQYPKSEPHLRAALETRSRRPRSRARRHPDRPRRRRHDPPGSGPARGGRAPVSTVPGGRRRVLGPEHPDTLASSNNLALLVQQRGRLDEAESLLRQCLEIKRRVLGSEHTETLTTMQNLAILYSQMGRNSEAEPLLVEAYADGCRACGPEQPTHADRAQQPRDREPVTGTAR